VEDGYKIEGANSSKIIVIFSNTLKLAVNGCHKCVCNLFQVIKHISTDLYVYELTLIGPPKNVTGKHDILLKARIPDALPSKMNLLEIRCCEQGPRVGACV